jgi:hypothetical protein
LFLSARPLLVMDRRPALRDAVPVVDEAVVAVAAETQRLSLHPECRMAP